MDKEKKVQHFSDLSFKDKSAYITAIASFCLGWLLLFIGVILPPLGEISPSVLSGFGMSLVYTAGVFGIYLYVKGSSVEIYSKIMEKVSQQIDQKLRKGSTNENY